MRLLSVSNCISLLPGAGVGLCSVQSMFGRLKSSMMTHSCCEEKFLPALYRTHRQLLLWFLYFYISVQVSGINFVTSHCNVQQIVKVTASFVISHCNAQQIVKVTVSFVTGHCNAQQIVKVMAQFVASHFNNNNNNKISFIETRLHITIDKIIKYKWLG